MLHHHPVAGKMGWGNCLIPNSISVSLYLDPIYGFRKTLIKKTLTLTILILRDSDIWNVIF